MASFQTRKSTAPPPPPLSQLWQMATSNNRAFLHSDEQILDDDEMNKMLNNIKREYTKPQPPLHATHAVTNQYHHSFDNIMKNTNKSKSKSKNRIFEPSNANRKRKRAKPKKRIIRPINANANTNANTNANITNMTHHRRESNNIDAFLRHRLSQSELKKRHILVESNKNEKEKIKSNLNRKLSNKFRPNPNELYDRGIYITDPKNPQNAAWNHANQRRRNSKILAQKFNKRPPPNDVLNRGIITKSDYFEMFNVLPQTQPTSPSTPIIDDVKHRLSLKIMQRPSIDEMKARGILYEESADALQNRNRELHRRRASKILEKFLLKRPKAETLKKRRIIISQKESTNNNKKKVWITQGRLCHSKRRESSTIGDFLLRRPNADKLVSRHILPSEYVQSNHINYDFKTAKQNYIKRRKQSRTDLEKHLLQRLNQNAIPYRYFMPNTDRSRASLVLEQFLPVRPEIQQLWDRNILPSLPPSPHKLTKPSHIAIDKRRNTRKHSMAMLELKLSERAPRESLFELGILKMSPAPSPPPLSVLKSSIYQLNNVDNNAYHDAHAMDNVVHNANVNKTEKRNKTRGSLVLNEYLGQTIANKLDQHLHSRPHPLDLINRGIVPTYSFTGKFSNPTTFAKHRRNMTLELQQRLESKLKYRPSLNDLPQRFMNANNDTKEKYWTLLMEGKERYKQFETAANRNEIELRQKLEAIQNECQSLSTQLIHKNTQIKEQQIEFEQRLNRLKLQYKEQYERQQKTISMGNEAQSKLRKEIESLQDTDNLNLKEALKRDKEYISRLMKHDPTPQLDTIQDRITKIESNYQSGLGRERIIHRKFNEQSERVKQTLVDEINKMEIQHQSKLLNLENHIVELKQRNRELIREKHIEINKERNIATIMVEDLDEEKTRLIQEMKQIKKEYDKKLAIQKQQINQLRQVAEDAVFYGNKAMNAQTKQNNENNNENNENMIHQLETKLNDTQNKCKILKKNKEDLEKKVLYLAQQILDTFSNNLSDDVKKKLNLIHT